MSYSTSALIMLAAGIGVPVLAALNAHLGKFLGSPLLAVTTLLFVAFFTSLAALLSSSELAIASILSAPKYLFLAGLLMVFYILSITTIAPNFGIGNAVFFVLIGQLVSAAVLIILHSLQQPQHRFPRSVPWALASWEWAFGLRNKLKPMQKKASEGLKIRI